PQAGIVGAGARRGPKERQANIVAIKDGLRRRRSYARPDVGCGRRVAARYKPAGRLAPNHLYIDFLARWDETLPGRTERKLDKLSRVAPVVEFVVPGGGNGVQVRAVVDEQDIRRV